MEPHSSPVSCPDQWGIFECQKLVSISWMYRLLSPLQSSHSVASCPILFHSLVALWSLTIILSCFKLSISSNSSILIWFSLWALFLSLGLFPSFYLSISHIIPHLSLSHLLHPPTLWFLVPKALGSQQWIITHLKNLQCCWSN